jgi:hypothetical protein
MLPPTLHGSAAGLAIVGMTCGHGSGVRAPARCGPEAGERPIASCRLRANTGAGANVRATEERLARAQGRDGVRAHLVQGRGPM